MESNLNFYNFLKNFFFFFFFPQISSKKSKQFEGDIFIDEPVLEPIQSPSKTAISELETQAENKKNKIPILGDSSINAKQKSGTDKSTELPAAGNKNTALKNNNNSAKSPAPNQDGVAAANVDEGSEEGAVALPGLAVSRESCMHNVALPPGWSGPDPLKVPPPARKPAKSYPFVLDAFQREAVNSLEKGESVLVSAHTSAGKTAVAEYAIAMSLRDGQRVIYTSPIKALSNQKYRELNEELKDVGLMTGDVTISPEASCLVMTTEVCFEYRI